MFYLINQKGSKSGTQLFNGLRFFLLSHVREIKGALSEIIRKPLSSFVTISLIGISIGLPSIFVILGENFLAGLDRMDQSVKINVFLDKNVLVTEGLALSKEIQNQPDVSTVRFISSEEAIKEFQKQTNLSEILFTLGQNPLPHVVEVVPVSFDPIDVAILVSSLNDRGGVESASTNLSWLERLYGIFSIVRSIGIVFAVTFFVGLILVVAHTIGVAIQNKAEEIELMFLLGATSSFIKRPFLYLGFWYGLGGGLFANLITQISFFPLVIGVERLAQSYQSSFSFDRGGSEMFFLILLIGVFLGTTGAFLALSKKMGEINPKRHGYS